MSNYEVKCVYSDLFLIKIGKQIRNKRRKNALAKNAS